MNEELDLFAAALSPLLHQASEAKALQALRNALELAFAMGACDGAMQLQAAVHAREAIVKAAG